MNPWLYAAVCVIAPAVWGSLMYLVFGWVHRRRTPPPEALPPADYTI